MSDGPRRRFEELARALPFPAWELEDRDAWDLRRLDDPAPGEWRLFRLGDGVVRARVEGERCTAATWIDGAEARRLTTRHFYSATPVTIAAIESALAPGRDLDEANRELARVVRVLPLDESGDGDVLERVFLAHVAGAVERCVVITITDDRGRVAGARVVLGEDALARIARGPSERLVSSREEAEAELRRDGLVRVSERLQLARRPTHLRAEWTCRRDGGRGRLSYRWYAWPRT